MTDNLSLEELIPLIESKLGEGGEVTFTVTGNSMLPMLHDRKDTVTLRAPDFPLSPYDLPFYRRKDGAYVLHRIVGTEQGKYITRGDNCNYTEYGIAPEDIIGVVTQFCRKGKNFSVHDKLYLVYSRLWNNNIVYFFRKKFIFYLFRIPKKAVKIILKKICK